MSVGYLPFSVDEIDIICSQIQLRPIWHYGVEMFGRQRYASFALDVLRSRIGVTPTGRSNADVKIKFRKQNIGHIWVYDVFERDWIKVLHPNQEYANGLTYLEHKLIKKMAIEMHLDSSDYRILIEARERLRVMIAELSQSNKLRDRKRAAKIVGLSTRDISNEDGIPDQIVNDRPTKSASMKSKAQPSVICLGDIVLDEVDDDFPFETINKTSASDTNDWGKTK